MKHLIIRITLILLTGSQIVSAQTNRQRYINQKSVGGFLSVGIPLYEIGADLNYHPVLVGGYLHLPLYQAKNKFNIAIDILPQAGIAPLESKLEYEFGLNIAFVFGFALSPQDIFSINLSSGPHYITANIARQAHGFIFSDNLNFTFRHKFNIVEVGFTAGVRHISNAGLEKPNRGIEDLLIGVTIAKPF